MAEKTPLSESVSDFTFSLSEPIAFPTYTGPTEVVSTTAADLSLPTVHTSAQTGLISSASTVLLPTFNNPSPTRFTNTTSSESFFPSLTLPTFKILPTSQNPVHTGISSPATTFLPRAPRLRPTQTYTQFAKDCVGPGKTHLDMPRLSYRDLRNPWQTYILQSLSAVSPLCGSANPNNGFLDQCGCPVLQELIHASLEFLKRLQTSDGKDKAGPGSPRLPRHTGTKIQGPPPKEGQGRCPAGWDNQLWSRNPLLGGSSAPFPLLTAYEPVSTVTFSRLQSSFSSIGVSSNILAAEVFPYGTYLVMFGFYLNVLRKHGFAKHRGLTSAANFLFIFCSAHCALQIATSTLYNQLESTSIGDSEFVFNRTFKDYSSVVIATNAMYITSNMIADSIFVSFASNNPELPLTRPGRIWWIGRTGRMLLGKTVTSRYYTSGLWFKSLESGAIYCASAIVFAAIGFTLDPIYSTTRAVLGQLVGIAPTIITIRVGLGRSASSAETFGVVTPRDSKAPHSRDEVSQTMPFLSNLVQLYGNSGLGSEMSTRGMRAS
ncbi:hypothetical protein B0H19DRAFT_1056647 [Mycena capillaripes]|nr:hypothetical protein B0H19DRAFT_1056647 [Mycena capillaripes]